MANDTSIVDETVETQAAPLPVQKPEGDFIEVTVTKLGAGRVSTGKRDEIGEIWAERGAKLMVSMSVALSLEERGFAETA